MRILLDVDGVYFDFVKLFTQLGVEMGVLPAVIETVDQKEWNFATNAGKDDGSIWTALKGSMNWWMRGDALISNEEVQLTNELIRQHDVYFITSRPRTMGLSVERQTEGWLDGIGIDASHAVVIATKTGTKGMLAKALDIDVALDDHTPNLLDLDEWDVTPVALTRHYNTGWGGPRVDSVAEFCAKVRRGW